MSPAGVSETGRIRHGPAPVAIRAGDLGSAAFRARHGLQYAYVAGAMYKGIASKDLVVRLGRAGMLGFLGTGGMKPDRMESDLRAIQAALGPAGVYGANFLSSPFNPAIETATADLFLRLGIPRIEAAAFLQVTPELVRLRASGLRVGPDGRICPARRILAKVSRPEVAAQFLAPAPGAVLARLVEGGRITPEESRLAARVPVADDLCVEADSGGHTDRGVLVALVPVMLGMRDDAMVRHRYVEPVGVGAAGGLGTPHAMAAALILGADFVLTGSINQCTVEAGTSDAVKELLEGMNIQDTDLVPAGDMFEMGAKVQVFKKGLLFPSRARRLYDLYRQYGSIGELDAATRTQLETRYFGRSIDQVWAETCEYYGRAMPEVIARAERDPKHKMALIFRWYFVHSSRLALRGDPEHRVDYQVHCGPALGAFNQWVRGTPLESWRARHVDEIGLRLLTATASLLGERLARYDAGSGAGVTAGPRAGAGAADEGRHA